MNKAILYGNIGKDPVIRTTDGGKKVASFSMATTSSYKDKDGNKATTWHNIVLWEKLAELAEKYIKKGSSVIIEGEIQNRSYTDKDGVTKYITEIIGRELHFTGKKESEKTALDLASDTAQFHEDLEIKANGKYAKGSETDLPF